MVVIFVLIGVNQRAGAADNGQTNTIETSSPSITLGVVGTLCVEEHPPMSEDKAEQSTTRILGLSRFDLTVGIVVLVLIAAISLVAFFGSPARRGPMVAYLYPLDATLQDIWIAPVDDPSAARQLTQTEVGIYDFAVSPDGRSIAYSERDPETLLLDIYLLDLGTGSTRRLTNCGDDDSECHTPTFHPEGGIVAYMRQSLNRELETVGPGVPRIWLLQLENGATQPLSPDQQLIGHSPQWADDGNSIAFYSADLMNPGIVIYNFNPQTGNNATVNFIPSAHGSVGALSPNGRQLVFPDIVERDGAYYTHLKIADLDADPPEFTDFTDPQGPTDDIAVDWHPDGRHVTMERRFTDDRYTRGYQLYQVDMETEDIVPLLYDERYSHHYFAWNTQGTMLVIQRLQLLEDSGEVNRGARPEIWVLNTETGDLIQIAEQAYFPRWVTPEG